MTAWMLYALLGGVWFSAAALLAERVLLSGRVPLRAIWIGALICSVVLPVVAFEVAGRTETAATIDATLSTLETETGASDARASVTGSSLASAPAPRWWARSWGASLSRLDLPLTTLWTVLSLVLALNFVGGVGALALMRRRWERRTVLGNPVFVSDMTGPALVGVVSPMIVLPRWVLDLHPDQLALMLAHEVEHRRAGDGRLLTLAELALIAMPWNLALWWQVLRLRVAVELDCDARVVRHADRRSYGDLLIEMARMRRGPRLLGSAAFAERAVHLERRIRMLARRPPGAARRAAAAAACIGLASLTLAWAAPRPALPAVGGAPPRVVPEMTLEGASQPVTGGDTHAASAAAAREGPSAGAVVPASLDQPEPTRSQAPAYPANACAFASQGGVAAPLVDSAFSRLFTGISLGREQQSSACALLAGLEREQRAANEAAREELRKNAVAAGAMIARRNDALRALVVPEAAAILTARTAPGPRSAGAGQGTSGGQPQAPAANASASATEQAAEAIFLRLFDGIPLTPVQDSSARAVILKGEEELAPLRPVAPTILRFVRGTRAVSVRAPSDAELTALLSSDAGRALLRSRLVTAPR